MDFPNGFFSKQDTQDDGVFYTAARKVVHIDDGAIRAATALYDRLLLPLLPEVPTANAAVLDLMSSWRSHLSAEVAAHPVVGLGMNGEEMADNPQLKAHHVQNLNRTPRLPFDDGQFAGAVCTVSVQYLTQPAAVFGEVARVLRPGGVFAVTFSNRCFPSKAINGWLQMSDAQHLALVARYFELSGNNGAAHAWRDVQAQQVKAGNGWFGGDPLFAVWAYKRSS
jgi:SAM-dependent methyltransferase